MSKLNLVKDGVTHPVLQYAMPLKGTPVDLSINGFEVQGRVTNARGRTYTYFPYAGGEFYVAGELGEGDCQLNLPEGFKPREVASREIAYNKAKDARAAAKAAKEAAGEAPEKAPRAPRKPKAEQQPAV